MNKIVIIGIIGKDAEVKAVKERFVNKFSVAVNDKFKKQEGKVNLTTWFQIEYWNNRDVIGKYLKKGTKVAVCGRMDCSEYTDNSGVKKFPWKIIAENVELLGSPEKPKNDSNNSEDLPDWI